MGFLLSDFLIYKLPEFHFLQIVQCIELWTVNNWITDRKFLGKHEDIVLLANLFQSHWVNFVLFQCKTGSVNGKFRDSQRKYEAPE